MSSGSRAIASTVRQAVASEATAPKSGSWSRTARTSERCSPPEASITARSRTTRPGSWAPRRSRIGARPFESASVSPIRSAVSANRATPAWETTPSPSAVTSTVNSRPSCCTFMVILLSVFASFVTRRISLQADETAPWMTRGAVSS
jgi:hypothetical protein